MAKLTIEGADQLRQLAAKLRDADPKIRRELGKALRPSIKTITSEIQDTVRSAPSEGRGGKNARGRRAARTLARSRRLSTDRAKVIATKRHGLAVTSADVERTLVEHRAKQAAKAEASAGLRETIARAVGGSISTGSRATGVSVTWKVAAAKMPNSQRLMPKNFNRAKGWRHPVFGDRENWVAQKGTPFFDDVIKKHQNELGNKIVEGMQNAAEAILHDK
jgi:hypothetical protein